MFTKLSIMFFYKRVLASYSRSVLPWIIRLYIGIIIIWAVLFTLLLFINPRPFNARYNRDVYMFGFMRVDTTLYSLSISDLVLDIMIMILPLPHVRD